MSSASESITLSLEIWFHTHAEKTRITVKRCDDHSTGGANCSDGARSSEAQRLERRFK